MVGRDHVDGHRDAVYADAGGDSDIGVARVSVPRSTGRTAVGHRSPRFISVEDSIR